MKKPSGPRTGEFEQSLVDFVAIDQLAKIVTDYDLSEIEINLGELRVRLARHEGSSARAALAPALERAKPSASPPANAAGAAIASEAATADLAGAVKSPMVGTAYLRASPEAKPFVEIGSAVKAGDKLMLVEAMKTFIDIAAETSGVVVAILAENGDEIEAGQALFRIRPTGAA
jgi:acetyl-CoA carboxylase biotin carboxyl carrier protein